MLGKKNWCIMDGTFLKYWGGDILDDTFIYIYIYIYIYIDDNKLNQPEPIMVNLENL